MGLFGVNLENQFVAYGSHHNNRVNIAIHLVFVPLILWSACVMAQVSFGAILPSFFIPVLGPLIGSVGGITVGYVVAMPT
jgi:uncharacterized membrane protein YGL010W